MLETIFKLTVTVIFVIFVGALLVRLWRSDIDMRQLFRPDQIFTRKVDDTLKWLPTLDPAAIYQDDRVVGRVEGVHVDEAAHIVTFAKITDAGALDYGRPFFFQKWQLRIEQIGSSYGAGVLPPQPVLLAAVRAVIIGSR